MDTGLEVTTEFLSNSQALDLKIDNIHFEFKLVFKFGLSHYFT